MTDRVKHRRTSIASRASRDRAATLTTPGAATSSATTSSATTKSATTIGAVVHGSASTPGDAFAPAHLADGEGARASIGTRDERRALGVAAAHVVATERQLAKDARWLRGAALRALADDAPSAIAWDARCKSGLVSVVAAASLCGAAVVVTPAGALWCDASALRRLDKSALAALLKGAVAHAAELERMPSIAARAGHLAGGVDAVDVPCPGGVVHYPAGDDDRLLAYTMRRLSPAVREVVSVAPYAPDAVGSAALPGGGGTWTTVDGDALQARPAGEARPGVVVIKGPGDFGALHRHARFLALQIAALLPGGTLASFPFRGRDVAGALPLEVFGLSFRGLAKDVCGNSGDVIELFVKQRDVPADVLMDLLRIDRALLYLARGGRFPFDIEADPELSARFPSRSPQLDHPSRDVVIAAVHAWLHNVGDPTLTQLVGAMIDGAGGLRHAVPASGVDVAARSHGATAEEQDAAIALLRRMAAGEHAFTDRRSDAERAIAAKNTWCEGHEHDDDVRRLLDLALAHATLHAVDAWNRLADVDAPIPEAVLGRDDLESDVSHAARYDPALAARLREAVDLLRARRRRLGV